MNKNKGLTLIEVLVAMSILAIIILILYSVFSISLRGWRKSDNMLQAATIARVVLDRMTREISSAIVKEGSSEFYCIGFDVSSPSGFRTNSAGDEFYFIAPLKKDNLNGSDLCEVGYWIDDQGTGEISDDVLRRFYVVNNSGSTIFDFDFSTPTGKANSNELATDITGLRFEFFDDTGVSFTSWDSRSSMCPPARIKVTITVAVGKGSKTTNPDFVTQDFSSIISLP